jgi:hypothetical protein
MKSIVHHHLDDMPKIRGNEFYKCLSFKGCLSCKHDTSIHVTPITTTDNIPYTESNPYMYSPDAELGQVSDMSVISALN